MREITELLRFVSFKDADGIWVTICLDHDIVAQGKSQSDSLVSMGGLLQTWRHIDAENAREPFSKCSPAPKEYWDMLEVLEKQVAK